MGKHTVLKLALVVKVTSMAVCYCLLKIAFSRPDIPEKDPPLWDKCPECEGSFKLNSIGSLGGLSMISGLIAGLYLNSLIKEKSQNLEDQLPVAKKCARLVTSVAFVVLYIIVITILVIILVLVIGLK
jgi:hypothetical protein